MTVQIKYLFLVGKENVQLFHETAWRVLKKLRRTSTYTLEVTGRDFQLHVFTKSRPLFLLPDKSAFPFVGKTNPKYEKKPNLSLNSRLSSD